MHRHKKLAPESGAEFMAPISVAGLWNVYQAALMESICLKHYEGPLGSHRRAKAHPLVLPHIYRPTVVLDFNLGMAYLDLVAHCKVLFL